MGLGEFYILFMVSVGLWACYELMYPSLRQLKDLERHDDVLLRSKFVSYSTMFCIAAVFAPLFVFLIMVPNLNNAIVLAMVDRDE